MAERNDYNEIDERTPKKGNATVGASIAGATAGETENDVLFIVYRHKTVYNMDTLTLERKI